MRALCIINLEDSSRLQGHLMDNVVVFVGILGFRRSLNDIREFLQLDDITVVLWWEGDFMLTRLEAADSVLHKHFQHKWLAIEHLQRCEFATTLCSADSAKKCIIFP